MGGTQDNGTWSNTDHCDREDVQPGDLRRRRQRRLRRDDRVAFNEFTSGSATQLRATATRSSGSSPSLPFVRSGEGRAFYWPQVGDPNPVPGHAPDLLGRAHVWRSGRSARAIHDSGAAGHEPRHRALRGELSGVRDRDRPTRTAATTGRSAGRCCDAVARRRCRRASTSPATSTGTAYGTDRAGGIDLVDRTRQRRPRNDLGRDLGGPDLRDAQRRRVRSGTVTWHRIDSSTRAARRRGSRAGSTSTRQNPSHAWISYSGYNAVTPTTPGHVFDVTRTPASPGSGTFTNLNVESGSSAFPTPTNDGDLPSSDVVRDDANADAVRRRPTSASCAATTTARAAGTSRRACLATRSCTSRSSRPRASRPARGKRQCKPRAVRGDALAGHLEDGSRR